jgi:hypothetical protein
MARKYKLLSTGEVFEAEVLKHDNGMELTHWCGGRIVTEVDPFDDALTFFGINVPTLAGTRRCSQGDYIVKSDTGYFHVVARFEFENTYRPCSIEGDEVDPGIVRQIIAPEAFNGISGEVPLVQYDDDGRRRIVGRAKVTGTPDGVRVDATLTEPTPGLDFDDWISLSVHPTFSRNLAEERKQKFNWLSIKDERDE